MTPRPRDRAKGLYLDVVAVSNENVSFFLSLEAMVMDRVDVVTRIVGANFGNQVELDEYTAEYLLQSLLLDDAEDDLEQLRETLAGLLETLVGEGVGVSRCVDELVASRDELASRKAVRGRTIPRGCQSSPLLRHCRRDPLIGPAPVFPALRSWWHPVNDRLPAFDNFRRLQKR